MAEKKKKRSRLGDWERFTQEQTIEGCLGVVLVKMVRVTYGGHEWVVADTPSGRKIATNGIHEVLKQQGRIRKVNRAAELIVEAVSDLQGEVLDTDPAVVVAAIKDLADAMEGKKTLDGDSNG